MDNWRTVEELDIMREWDADAVCDALNITASELVTMFLERAINYIEDNCE